MEDISRLKDGYITLISFQPTSFLALCTPMLGIMGFDQVSVYLHFP